jgi:hypothetical protein
MVRSMMIHSDSVLQFWGEAVLTATRVLHCTLTRANKKKTPTELYENFYPLINHLHAFGCDAYYYIQKPQREGKLDAVATSAIFVGHDWSWDNNYKLYDMTTNKFVVTRDVKFFDDQFTNMKKLKEKMMNERTDTSRRRDDDALPDFLTVEMIEQLFTTDQNHHDRSNAISRPSVSSDSPPSLSSVSPAGTNTQLEEEENENDSNDTSSRDVSLRGRDKKETKDKKEDEGKRENEKNSKKRKRKNRDSGHGENEDENDSKSELPRRKRGRPRKNSGQPSVVAAAIENREKEEKDVGNSENEKNDSPSTYEEATKSEEKNAWMNAINDELRAHEKNNTWSVVKRNASMNIIDTKWVFTKKKDENGVVKRYKARVVARGLYRQQANA